MFSLKAKEEQIKHEVAERYFKEFDCKPILGNIDFAVAIPMVKNLFKPDTEYMLWAEAKHGNKSNIYESFIQLILTIGKERTYEKNLPPTFIGAFDAEKIAFIPYHNIMDVFFQNDFNWNITPSNHESKEFKLLKAIVRKELDANKADVFLFEFGTGDKELFQFINKNFKSGKMSVSKMQITKNNFTYIYAKWCGSVKNTINIDWSGAKKVGLLDADFFLADILSQENMSIMDKLHVLLRNNHYELEIKKGIGGLWNSTHADFKDGMKAHRMFWAKYERPPRKEFWDYFVARRDLLVPQDVRERKGSYFTPMIWVEKAQEYLANVFGENWQDEYYVWDCCAGTGNLLAGLTNKYRIWASTLDDADVKVMMERIENGANLLNSHVFKFDFLNDDFSLLPKSLQDVLANPDERKKLIVFINPPYAETAKKKIGEKDRINKRGVSFTKIQQDYAKKIGIATKELFAQFFIRIKVEIPNCKLAQFSTMKFIQGPNFSMFREVFTAKFLKGFVVPANTFDNVKGAFPIGFMVWDLESSQQIKEVECDIYESKGNCLGKRAFRSYSVGRFITEWYRQYHTRTNSKDNIGAIGLYGSDFQHNNMIYITNVANHTNRWTYITKYNLIPSCIYFALRHCLEATWLNDRDQYTYPNSSWQFDTDFQFDCLAYSLFSGANRITSDIETNHWIPFIETDVDAQDSFQSHFMSDFIKGKLKFEAKVNDLFIGGDKPQSIVFTSEAQSVMDAGKELWKYYHSQAYANPNASFLDIRRHFQGIDNGKMNNGSEDEIYTELIKDLREKLKVLAKQIEKKAYIHGFVI